jgi:hypothetical protein
MKRKGDVREESLTLPLFEREVVLLYSGETKLERILNMIIFWGYTSGERNKEMDVHLGGKNKVSEHIEHVLWAQHADIISLTL